MQPAKILHLLYNQLETRIKKSIRATHGIYQSMVLPWIDKHHGPKINYSPLFTSERKPQYTLGLFVN